MPTVDRDGTTLYYETAGERATGEAGGDPVAFVSDAGFGAWLWGWQYPAVAGPRKALVWDLRGTGQSDSSPGPYDLSTLAADFEAVLAEVGLDSVHVVGAGLGGAIALRYAREYGRAQSLTLLCTPDSGETVDSEALQALHPDASDDESIQQSLSGAFSPAFREANADLLADICDWRREEDAGSDAVEAQLATLTGFDPEPLYEVGLPALVLYGVDDPVVPASASTRLAEDLPRGESQAVEGRHLCFVEHSRAVTDRLLAHIEAQESA